MRIHNLWPVIAFMVVSAFSPASNAQDPNNRVARTQTDAETRLLQQKEIFPRIPDVTSRALPIIASYAKKLDLKPLEKNHMRSFVQPVGIVSEAVDVNLTTGDFIIYPGTRDNSDPRKNTINSKDLAELRSLLTSKEFLSIPQRNNKMGADGSSYVLEADINDSYIWRDHWSTDDQNLLIAMYKINSIITTAWMYSYAQTIGIGILKTNHVRLFADASRNNTYSITDIDLISGKLIRNRQDGIRENTLNTVNITQLKQMLTAEEFHKMMMDSRGRLTGIPGANGIAHMIEYDIDGIYFRIIVSATAASISNGYFNKVNQQISDFVNK